MSSVQLNWNANSLPGSTYAVSRNGAVIVSGLAATNYLDTAVADATTYVYQVFATNTVGTGLPSDQASVTTPPAQVQGLTATPLSSSQINLAWTATPGATTYTVRRGTTVVGTPAGTSFPDTGLSASTLYTYTVAANGTGGQGAQSSPASATTQAASSGIVWLPGHIGRTGSGNATGLAGNLSTVLSFISSAVAADIHNQLVGFCVPALWANLEGPTAGTYDGSWAGSQAANSGFAGIQQLINLLKSFTPKRYLMISLNQTGNGMGANTNTAFPSSFAPSYLNSSTYDGGCEWGGRSGYSGYPNVNTTLWNVNTALRVAALVKAYYDHFGAYDPVSGNGIYMWELTNELSLQTSSMITGPAFVNAIVNGYSTIRTQCLSLMLSMRPTFVNPGTPANYSQICQAMFNAKICMANEDGSNNPFTGGINPRNMSWGDAAYAAVSPTGTGLPNHVALGDWAHVFNVENAEYGQERNAPLAAVPPADVGSGYLYDNPSFPGIMSGANYLKSSHIIWFLDTQAGPNVNRFKFPVTNGTQPANPTPGPGAGLTSARPHLIDVITGNTAQPGITGPIPIPRTTRPAGW